jgi:pimeloyl-ACP methyl ester carboxylesterase
MRRKNTPPVTVESLSAITCPVLVVLGDKDFAGPAQPLMDALVDARLVTLRNVDHFATPKDFGFIEASLDFLAALP